MRRKAVSVQKGHRRKGAPARRSYGMEAKKIGRTENLTPGKFHIKVFFVTLHPKAFLTDLSGMHGFNVSAALGAIGSPALRYGQHKMTNRDGGESFTFYDATHNCLLSNVLWQHAGIVRITFFIRWTLRPTT